VPSPHGPAARDTGISTYVVILDNNKPATRKGKRKVQLINAVDMFGKMR
jgi:type I restriction enzyme M protein